MGDQTKQLKQKQIDELIVAQMTAYRDEFLGFYNKYYKNKGIVLKPDSQYEIGPFELFVIEKLSLMKIDAELKRARLENRVSNNVKELLNEFMDKMNEFLGVTDDDTDSDG